MSDILQVLANMAQDRLAAAQAAHEAASKRWRLICGELYMMQNEIRREQQHTPGTGKNG